VLARTRVAFVNYPNNPTAAIAPLEYLERTVAICRRHGILLAYDNAYCDLTFDGYVAPSIFEIPGARDVAVEFFSLSKTFSMTGWRLGWAAGRAELIGALTKVKSYVDTGPFLALQKAGVVALERTEELAAPVRATLTERRDACVAALRDTGLAVESPKAAMYLWVPLPKALRRCRSAGACWRKRRWWCWPGVVRTGRRRVLPDRAHGRAGTATRGGEPAGSHPGKGTRGAACDGNVILSFRRRGTGGWWIAIAAALVVHLILLSVEAVGMVLGGRESRQKSSTSS
jgi:hypothetical protein